jgi:hypothetical protein
MLVAARDGVVLLDHVQVQGSLAGISHVSTSSPDSLGMAPFLSPGSPPVVGNLAFQVDTMNLLPNGISVMLLALSSQTVPVPGAPPTCAVLANILANRLQLNSPLGRATYPLSLPNVAAFVGTQVSWQAVDLDQALPFALPIANSSVLTTTLGGF